MDWNKLFSILGLCLGLFGTIFSLWAALAIKIEDIKKRATWAYLEGGASKDSAKTKFQGKIGLMILSIGTIFQIIGISEIFTDMTPVCIIFMFSFVAFVVLLFIFKQQEKKEQQEIDDFLHSDDSSKN